MRTLLLPSVVMYNRDFVALGGVNCAVYLSNLLWEMEQSQTDDGWLHERPEEMQKRTGLSPHEQTMARKLLRGLGIVTNEVRGQHAHFIKVSMDKLLAALKERDA